MYVEKLYNGVFNIVTLGIATFGDGIQIGDVVKLPAFYDEAKNIYESLGPAKAEIVTATPEQVAGYVNDFTNRLLTLINVPDAPAEDYSVDNCILAVLAMEGIVQAIEARVKDGIQLDDLAALPYVVSKIWELIGYMPMVRSELAELSKREISLLASTLVYKVYMNVLGWGK